MTSSVSTPVRISLRRSQLITAAVLAFAPLLARAQAPADLPATPGSSTETSSSSSFESSTSASTVEAAPAPEQTFVTRPRSESGYERISPAGRHQVAFTRFATAIKVSTWGYGLEVATPFTPKTNLRLAGNWFDVGTDFSVAGIRLGTDLHMRSAQFAFDYQPFRHIGFQLTPGLMFYNANRLTGSATVPGGDSLTPGNGHYISSRLDPVKGSVSIGMDHIAPTFTVGFGNLLPRNGSHWSIPFEVGFAYTGAPSVRLDLRGTVCDRNGTNCRAIPTAPDVLANIALEAANIQSAITPLSVYPTVSIGFAYNFGSMRGFRNR